jgi:hypothetical protein
VSLDGQIAIADPFAPTAEVTELVQLAIHT